MVVGNCFFSSLGEIKVSERAELKGYIFDITMTHSLEL